MYMCILVTYLIVFSVTKILAVWIKVLGIRKYNIPKQLLFGHNHKLLSHNVVRAQCHVVSELQWRNENHDCHYLLLKTTNIVSITIFAHYLLVIWPAVGLLVKDNLAANFSFSNFSRYKA